MAKSGIYLNGRELLECELDKLDPQTRDFAIHNTIAEVELDSKINLAATRKAAKMHLDFLDRLSRLFR